MTHTDAKQKRLHALFAELRRLKREEMPWKCEDPIMQAQHDASVRECIGEVEQRIEREMDDG